MAMTSIRKANRALARQVKEQESSYDPASIPGSKEDLDMKSKGIGGWRERSHRPNRNNRYSVRSPTASPMKGLISPLGSDRVAPEFQRLRNQRCRDCRTRSP